MNRSPRSFSTTALWRRVHRCVEPGVTIQIGTTISLDPTTGRPAVGPQHLVTAIAADAWWAEAAATALAVCSADVAAARLPGTATLTVHADRTRTRAGGFEQYEARTAGAEHIMTWWYIARASGIVSLLLSGMAVIWGLVLAGRFGGKRRAPRWLLTTHRFIGATTVTFTGVHVGALVLDDYVHFGWREILVPFTSSWHPVAVAYGVIAAYLLVAVQLSSMMMRRLPRKLWRAIHLSSYGLYLLGLTHGATSGTDAAHPLYLAATGLTTLGVVWLTITRVLAARSRRQPRGEPSVVSGNGATAVRRGGRPGALDGADGAGLAAHLDPSPGHQGLVRQ